MRAEKAGNLVPARNHTDDDRDEADDQHQDTRDEQRGAKGLPGDRISCHTITFARGPVTSSESWHPLAARQASTSPISRTAEGAGRCLRSDISPRDDERPGASVGHV